MFDALDFDGTFSYDRVTKKKSAALTASLANIGQTLSKLTGAICGFQLPSAVTGILDAIPFKLLVLKWEDGQGSVSFFATSTHCLLLLLLHYCKQHTLGDQVVCCNMLRISNSAVSSNIGALHYCCVGSRASIDRLMVYIHLHLLNALHACVHVIILSV